MGSGGGVDTIAHAHVDDIMETKERDPGAGGGEEDTEEKNDGEKGDEEEGWGKFCTLSTVFEMPSVCTASDKD